MLGKWRSRRPAELTVDDEDYPEDVRLEVSSRVLHCLRPLVSHVSEPKRRDADHKQRDDENA